MVVSNTQWDDVLHDAVRSLKQRCRDMAQLPVVWSSNIDLGPALPCWISALRHELQIRLL